MPRRQQREAFDTLVRAFGRIGRDQQTHMLERAARAISGQSSLRVLGRQALEEIRQELVHGRVSGLLEATSEAEHRTWFCSLLSSVAPIVKRYQANNRYVMPGYKWGFGARAVTIFERECVFNTRLLPDDVVSRILPWMYAPVDGRLLYLLNGLGFAVPATLREMVSERRFNAVQDLLGRAAQQAGIPRAFLDHKWLDQEVRYSLCTRFGPQTSPTAGQSRLHRADRAPSEMPDD